MVRYHCSAGGEGGVGLRSGSASSGYGSAGSLRLFYALKVGVVPVEEHCASGPVLGWRGPLYARYHLRMLSVRRLAVRDVRFGVRCKVDLDSPGKRGLEFSKGRR